MGGEDKERRSWVVLNKDGGDESGFVPAQMFTGIAIVAERGPTLTIGDQSNNCVRHLIITWIHRDMLLSVEFS